MDRELNFSAFYDYKYDDPSSIPIPHATPQNVVGIAFKLLDKLIHDPVDFEEVVAFGIVDQHDVVWFTLRLETYGERTTFQNPSQAAPREQSDDGGNPEQSQGGDGGSA